MRFLAKFWAITLLPMGLYGQAGFDSDFKHDWETSKQFTLAVAASMPVEKYGFKVSPEEMSFAALMLHIAGSQAFRFAQVAGQPNPIVMPQELPKESAKEAVMKVLAESFDYCIAQLSKFTAAQLKQIYDVDWYERPKVNGREMVYGMFTHTAHHRAQAEVYLRANGIQPPPYRF